MLFILAISSHPLIWFIRTVISQLVYSLGFSSFAAVNGSMMIEVVPFFAILVEGITIAVGEDKPKEIIATTMVAFALSSVLTGELDGTILWYVCPEVRRCGRACVSTSWRTKVGCAYWFLPKAYSCWVRSTLLSHHIHP